MSIIVKNKNGEEFTVAGAGKNGTNGKSAYQIAVDNGYTGTEAEWLASLKGQDGADGTDGAGVPSGGAVGKFLKKKTDNDFDAEWGDVDLTADEVTGVLPVTKGGTGGTIWPSNPNLLINGDFRKPVNRNGKREYTAPGYTIDRWLLNFSGTSVLLNSGYITITRSSGSAFFVQLLNEYLVEIIRGKTVTFSILDNSKGLLTKTVNIPQTGDFDISPLKNGNWDFNLQCSGTAAYFRIYSALASNLEQLELIAAKLELGSVQTIAHKEGDTWVLNDPPNYDLQYALCSQYSPITDEFVGSQHSNPNLLDNWYFADPINQRGLTEYTGAGYTIDRWRVYGSGTITLHQGYLGITGSDSGIYFASFLEDVNIIGKEITLSVLMNDNQLYMATGIPTKEKAIAITNAGSGYIIVQIHSSNRLMAQFNAGPGYTYSPIAIKLELGPVQTIAHKEGDTWVLNDPPPSPSLELLKCQRYFQVFETQSARHTKAADFRPTMRTEPTLSTITVDGKTLYTASADL